jgi:hypothetical protein
MTEPGQASDELDDLSPNENAAADVKGGGQSVDGGGGPKSDPGPGKGGGGGGGHRTTA